MPLPPEQPSSPSTPLPGSSHARVQLLHMPTRHQKSLPAEAAPCHQRGSEHPQCQACHYIAHVVSSHGTAGECSDECPCSCTRRQQRKALPTADGGETRQKTCPGNAKQKGNRGGSQALERAQELGDGWLSPQVSSMHIRAKHASKACEQEHAERLRADAWRCKNEVHE
jgi:hypothetical protein